MDRGHHCLVWKQHQAVLYGRALPLKDTYTRCCKNKTKRIIKDPNHLDIGLFSAVEKKVPDTPGQQREAEEEILSSGLQHPEDPA